MRKLRASLILDDTSSETRKKCNAEDSSGLSVGDMADLQSLRILTQIPAVVSVLNFILNPLLRIPIFENCPVLHITKLLPDPCGISM